MPEKAKYLCFEFALIGLRRVCIGILPDEDTAFELCADLIIAGICIVLNGVCMLNKDIYSSLQSVCISSAFFYYIVTI